MIKRKYILLITLLGTLMLVNGCASGAPSSMGSHGRESVLSDNKIEGLYLFKIETNQNVVTVTSGSDSKVGI